MTNVAVGVFGGRGSHGGSADGNLNYALVLGICVDEQDTPLSVGVESRMGRIVLLVEVPETSVSPAPAKRWVSCIP